MGDAASSVAVCLLGRGREGGLLWDFFLNKKYHLSHTLLKGTHNYRLATNVCPFEVNKVQRCTSWKITDPVVPFFWECSETWDQPWRSRFLKHEARHWGAHLWSGIWNPPDYITSKWSAGMSVIVAHYELWSVKWLKEITFFHIQNYHELCLKALFQTRQWETTKL